MIVNNTRGAAGTRCSALPLGDAGGITRVSTQAGQPHPPFTMRVSLLPRTKRPFHCS